MLVGHLGMNVILQFPPSIIQAMVYSVKQA